MAGTRWSSPNSEQPWPTQPIPPGVPPHDDGHCKAVSDDALRSSACTVSEEVIALVEGDCSPSPHALRVRIADTHGGASRMRKCCRETVEVTRVPVDKVVEIAPEIRTEGDVTIVPVLEQELHIRRRVKSEPSRCRLPCASSAPSWSGLLPMRQSPTDIQVHQAPER